VQDWSGVDLIGRDDAASRTHLEVPFSLARHRREIAIHTAGAAAAAGSDYSGRQTAQSKHRPATNVVS
jgi:hypothetical protein